MKPSSSEPSLRLLPSTSWGRRASWPPMACGHQAPRGAGNDHPHNDLGEDQRLAPESRGGAGMVSVL